MLSRREHDSDSVPGFPRTRHSVLDRLSSGEPEVRRAAFDALARGYWKAIYKYVRVKWGSEREDAEDLTQAFLAKAFEKRYLEGFDPGKARFRTYLRTCVDRFVMNERKAARRLKRGGHYRFVALDFQSAEGELRRHEPPDPVDMDEFFRHELVRDLFARSVSDLRDELRAAGKTTHLRLFERYDLDEAEGITYADLAREFELPITQVTNFLAAVRRSFRYKVLENLREISGTDEEYRADARELLGLVIE